MCEGAVFHIKTQTNSMGKPSRRIVFVYNETTMPQPRFFLVCSSDPLDYLSWLIHYIRREKHPPENGLLIAIAPIIR